MRQFILFIFFNAATTFLFAQDTIVEIDKKIITLKEVVVRNNMDVPGFIKRVQDDTSFYKAFKNLRRLNYSALNDIRMMDKKGRVKASLQNKTHQNFKDGCRTMEVLEENLYGDIRDKDGDWNYYTASMYAGLFFTKGKVCQEDNSVKSAELSLKDKRGLDKHKEQLKMLFFNPGRKIPGIPFIGDKINIYEPPMTDLYDFEIDMENVNGEPCYVFNISARTDLSRSDRNDIVIDSIKTWFSAKDMRILGRTYNLNYDAGIYDFDVNMQVEMGSFGDQVIPKLIRYNGNWKAPLKKREQGIFTATLFDFAQ